MTKLNNDPRFQINHNADLAKIGELVNEALFAFGEDQDSCRDLLFTIHGLIYPNASRLATAAENAAIAAEEQCSHNKILRIVKGGADER